MVFHNQAYCTSKFQITARKETYSEAWKASYKVVYVGKSGLAFKETVVPCQWGEETNVWFYQQSS